MSQILLQANNIIKTYGERTLLDIPLLQIYTGDRIGIVGANGSGKSTLMRILYGELQADSGSITRYADIGYIAQTGDVDADGERTVIDDGALYRYGVADIGDKRSGGEGTRLRIAYGVSGGADLLFADEPTCNLDAAGIHMLSRELYRFDTMLLISHDRSLLNAHCHIIWEVAGGTVKVYAGGYDEYYEARALAVQQQWDAYEQYDAERTRLTRSLREREGKAKSIKKAPSRMGNSEARLHKRSATEKAEKVHGAAKAIETRISKLEKVEKPREPDKVALDFSLTHPPANKIVMSVSDLCFAYGERVILNHISLDIPNGVKTAVTGHNGCGKTTLLNQLAYSDAVYRVPKANIGYFRQDFSHIDPARTVLENCTRISVQSETTVRTILARLLIRRDDVHKRAGLLSGGEMIKLSFAMLFVAPHNVLLLDEPTNYLDIPAIEALQDILSQFEGTVVMVSHDSVFVERVADSVLELNNGVFTKIR